MNGAHVFWLECFLNVLISALSICPIFIALNQVFLPLLGFSSSIICVCALCRRGLETVNREKVTKLISVCAMLLQIKVYVVWFTEKIINLFV